MMYIDVIILFGSILEKTTQFVFLVLFCKLRRSIVNEKLKSVVQLGVVVTDCGSFC